MTDTTPLRISARAQNLIAAKINEHFKVVNNQGRSIVLSDEATAAIRSIGMINYREVFESLAFLEDLDPDSDPDSWEFGLMWTTDRFVEAVRSFRAVKGRDELAILDAELKARGCHVIAEALPPWNVG